jgi:transcriptional regulator with XRE-family HTH domain
VNIDSIKSKLLARFRKRKNRRVFANKYLSSHIAAKMRALRISREMSQEKMSEQSGIHQPRISQLESPDYESYSLTTLKEMAEFFDVVPFFEFISFAELLSRIQSETPSDLAPPTFEQSFARAETSVSLPQEWASAPEPEFGGLAQILRQNNQSPPPLGDNHLSATDSSRRFEDMLAEGH